VSSVSSLCPHSHFRSASIPHNTQCCNTRSRCLLHSRTYVFAPVSTHSTARIVSLTEALVAGAEGEVTIFNAYREKARRLLEHDEYRTYVEDLITDLDRPGVPTAILAPPGVGKTELHFAVAIVLKERGRKFVYYPIDTEKQLVYKVSPRAIERGRVSGWGEREDSEREREKRNGERQRGR
jgi:hypothetical protein